MSGPVRARLVAIVPLLLIIAVAVVSMVVQRGYRERVPSAASVALLGRWFSPRLKAGDVVAVRPYWYSGIWKAIQPALRAPHHHKMLPFLELLNGAAIDPAQLAQARRLWLVRIAGLAPKQTLVLGKNWRPQPIALAKSAPTLVYRDLKPFEIRLFVKTRHRVRYDFVARLGDARVWRVGGGMKSGVCRWQSWQWICPRAQPNQGWLDVRTRVHNLHDAEPLAIVLNPGSTGATLHLRYDAVPFGRTLEGGFSTHLHAANIEHGDGIALEVRINGKPVAYRWQHPNKTSIQRFSVDTSLYRGEIGRVEFLFSASGSVHSRDVLLHAVSLD